MVKIPYVPAARMWSRTASVTLLLILCFLATSTDLIQVSAAASGGTCKPGDETCTQPPALVDPEENQSSCKDLHVKCPEWADIGECENNTPYMMKHCKASCDVCDSEDDDEDSEDEEYDSEDDEEEESEDDEEEEEDDPNCRDKHQKCPEWADLGECQANSSYMKKNCPKSCGSCTANPSVCNDKVTNCNEMVERGDCLAEQKTMMKNCRKSCYFCVDNQGDEAEGEEFLRKKRYKQMYLGPEQGVVGTDDEKEGAKENLRQVDMYVRQTMIKADVSDAERKACTNRSTSCAFWAGLGRCEDKRDFMIRQCRLACRACTESE